MPADLRRIKQRHLQCLVEVARAGSLTRAAEVLCVTAPAVSKTLKELDELVGVELFDRAKPGMVLSAAGEVFATHARQSVEVLQRGMREVVEMATTGAQVLRVAVLPAVAEVLLPTVLAALDRRIRLARIEVIGGTNSQALALLRHGEVDLVLGRLAGGSEMNGLAFEHLFDDEWLFAARAGHPLLAMGDRQLTNLADWPLVVPPRGTVTREEFDRHMAAAGLTRLPRLIETIYLSVGRQMAMSSDAVWLVSALVAREALAAGALQPLFTNRPGLLGPIGITTRPDSVQSAAVQQFMAVVREWASGPVGSATPDR